MNKINFYIIMLSVMLTACTKKKDMSLYIDDHLNDAAHVGNLEVKKQKEEVLNRIVEFDKWYREESGGIEYQKDIKFWNTDLGVNTDDDIRINYLKDSIIPRISKCPYFTSKLKVKAQKNSDCEDPGNMGMILTGSEYGKNLVCFSYMQEEDEYFYFHNTSLLGTDNGDGDDINAPSFRSISYEEAKFYHLSMIKMLSGNEAIYRVIIHMSNREPNYEDGYLILNLVKLSGEWMIDDMHYIEQEELIKKATGTRELLDYFTNKKAYETGIPRP